MNLFLIGVIFVPIFTQEESVMKKNEIVIFTDDRKTIEDSTLVALTIMLAESKPDEKEMMISVVMNCMK